MEWGREVELTRHKWKCTELNKDAIIRNKYITALRYSKFLNLLIAKRIENQESRDIPLFLMGLIHPC